MAEHYVRYLDVSMMPSTKVIFNLANARRKLFFGKRNWENPDLLTTLSGNEVFPKCAYPRAVTVARMNIHPSVVPVL